MKLLVGFESIKNTINPIIKDNEDCFAERSLTSFMKDFKEIDFTKIDETIVYLNKSQFSTSALFAVIQAVTTNNMSLIIDTSNFDEEENEGLDNLLEYLCDILKHLYIIDNNLIKEEDVQKFLNKILNES